MRHGFKSKADKKSLELRKELDVGENDFLDPYKLATYLDVEIKDPKNLGLPSSVLKILLESCSDEWSGLGTIQDGTYKIFLNTSHSQARLHSTLAHELAHFILEHEPMSVVNYFGIPRTCYNMEQEEEADYLGACLQIPANSIFYLFTFKMFNIEKLAEHFHCSKQMAQRRYNETGAKYKIDRYRKKRGQ